jgi:bifunctional non-homologous end joining protein LigD
MDKSLRAGKVFIDWSQNDLNKTTVSVYSLRARSRPTVSTPVTWREIERTLNKNAPELLTFEAASVVRRIDLRGDLFEPVRVLQQTLPAMGI